MKKISLWIVILMFSASLVRAQDTATQQQLDKLSGQIQDLLEAQAQQDKKLDALEKEISDLRDKVNTPAVTDCAKSDDLRNLAQKVQEVDQKRQDDSDMIVKQIEQLAKTIAATPPPQPSITHHHTPDVTPLPDAPNTPQNGYEYEIKQGDTLGLIVKAYRDKGVKVSKAQVIAANPKMNPDVLIPGRKIFIPDASAK